MKEDTYRDAKLWIEGFANVIHQRDILAAALRRINDNPCTECMHDQWALDALQEAGMDDNGPSKTVAGGDAVTTLYKLTNPDETTLNGMAWGDGVEHTSPGGGELCTAAWLHAYRDPILAVMMDPIHGAFGPSAHLWEADGEVGKVDGIKVGCTRLKTIRRMDLPVLTTEQRVRFAILSAMEVCPGEKWTSWATGWISGADRSESAAHAAANAAHAAAHAANAAAANAAIDLVDIAHRAVEEVTP